MSDFPRSVWDQGAEALRKGLLALDLPGRNTASQIQVMDPINRDQVLGAGKICLHYVAEKTLGYSNERQKIGYGFAVTDIDEISLDRFDGPSRWSQRREVIRRWCQPKRMPQVFTPGGHQLHTTYEPHSVDLPKGANNYRVHSFVVRLWMIEPPT